MRIPNEINPLTFRPPVAGQKDAAFKTACLLTYQINRDLETQRRHYRTKAGQLLITLDEVARAIITDNLLQPIE